MNLKRSLKKLFGGKKRGGGGRIINLYGVSRPKKVCISYILQPFNRPNEFKHQNYVTSHVVAETFHEMGYQVDVYDYQHNNPISYNEYDVIFGIGDNFEKSFYCANRSIPRIHLITGIHEALHNTNALRSIRDFYGLTKIWLPEETNITPVNHYYAMHEADVALIMAEGYVFDHCKEVFKEKLYTLNNNILGVFSEFEPKKERNSNFLFLSGGKQLTKGLPILLEVARLNPQLTFYVIVPRLNAVLENHYKDLFVGGNVLLFRDLRMDSKEMRQIVEACSYVVAPSYVDGMPGGTIEPMSAGLIPIVSKYCGFGKADFILEFEDVSVEGLNEMIEQVLKLDDGVFFNYSKLVKEYALSRYSKSNVKAQLKDILDRLLTM
ncbi:MAG: glycosyltransferase [Bacteroidota bacterium]